MAQSYASLIICINYIINHMFHLLVGATPFEVKFAHLSLKGIAFILDGSDY